MVKMVVIVAIAALVATLVAVLIPWLPDSASKEMDRIEFIYWFATMICIGIFALVAGGDHLRGAGRSASPPEDESDGPSIHGHTGLEIAWTVVPAILVIAIGVVSAVVLSQNGRRGHEPADGQGVRAAVRLAVRVPGDDGLKSDELVMPVDRSVKFELESADVIHSFWIPEMGQKQDVVPGIDDAAS